MLYDFFSYICDYLLYLYLMTILYISFLIFCSVQLSSFIYVVCRIKRNLGQITQGLVGCISMIHDSQTGTNFDLTSTLPDSLILEGRNIGESCYEIKTYIIA